MKLEILVSESAERVRKQTGVIPYRVTAQGDIEVMLIASSHSGSWGLPKGKKEKGMSKRESALVEAWEEAGLKGKAGKKLGTMSYRKGSTGVLQTVTYYAMRVETQHMEYPEQWRKRKWFPIAKAVKQLNKKNAEFLHKLEEII